MEKKIMSDYSCYCTEEQTRKALELGAPIESGNDINIYNVSDESYLLYAIPTAEEMIGFILETGMGYSIDLANLIHEQGYKQGCFTFIDNCLK